MTPRTDTDRRLSAIEGRVEKLSVDVRDNALDVSRKYDQNRADIHKIRNDEQSIIDGQHRTHILLQEVATKLSVLYGTDARQGQVAELREETRRDVEAMEGRLSRKIDDVHAEMKAENAVLGKKLEALAEELKGYALKYMRYYGMGLVTVMVLGWLLSHPEVVSHFFSIGGAR